ncbi:MAG: MotA/TolQ/ExbB proton channel family protein, partial [Burkholderiales bacterium]
MSLTTRLSALFAAVMVSAALFAAPAPSYAADAPAPAADTATIPMGVPTINPQVVSKEEVANPYGPDALWKNGDFVARSTLIILAIMSMGSWY